MPEEIREATRREGTSERADRDREFLQLAMKRFRLAEEAEATLRRDSLDDVMFYAGDQWPSDIQTSRVADGRPVLTMNRLPVFARQITNEQRQQRPDLVINPVGSGADLEIAQVYGGIIRHIKVQSDAEIAHDSAFERMVIGGWGYWRIATEYLDDNSWDQEIRIKRIKNPFSVYYDPYCNEPDYSDADYCFVVEDLPRKAYLEQYPNSALASLVEYEGVGNQPPSWINKETVRIAEYWHVRKTPKTLYQLETGEITDTKPDGVTAPKERRVIDRKVICSKINAVEILNSTDDEDEGEVWPGLWIPIVPCLGDDLDINGKRYLAGMVRNAKSPQRQYNYHCSAATEAIALAPKAPYVVAEGQIQNHESQWGQANIRNFAYLEYKPQSLAGQPLPPPQRNAVEPPIQSIMLMVRQSDNDLKSTIGIFDASLGQQGPEQSGRAILLRQKQGDVGTLNYSDNLGRSILFEGRQLLDLIPRIYDAPRIQRIINPDGSVKHVAVYNSVTSGIQDPQAALQDLQAGNVASAIEKIYDIGTGRYDVSLSVGPSYQSKRQESVSSMMTLVQAYPQVMAVIGDLLVKNMDWPGAQEIAERLKKILPPQLQDGDDPLSQAQRLQAQLQQLSQQHDLLTQALQKANEIISQKQIEAQNKYDIAQLQAQTNITTAEINARMADAKALADRELAQLQMMHDAAHERAMAASQSATNPPPTNGSGQLTGQV